MIKAIRNLITFCIVLLPIAILVAQDGTQIECGSIVDGEFVTSAERHDFVINIKAGTVIRLKGEALGDTLKFTILVVGPGKQGISASQTFGNVTTNPFTQTPVISANGPFQIWIGNTTIRYSGDIFGQSDSGGTGVYKLYVGCTLPDGTVIEPGDTLGGLQPNQSSPTPTDTRASFVGFPGLSPVDFSSAFRVPLNFSSINDGEIPVGGSNVLGFKFSADAGTKVELSFFRVTGNLNLGLVVLSSTNQVVYMVALINSETMASRFTIPTTGEYIVGVFRLDLLPPPIPENTSFQIQATLSS